MATKANVDKLSTFPKHILAAINTVGAAVATLHGAYTVIRKARKDGEVSDADAKTLIAMALVAHLPEKYKRHMTQSGPKRGSALERQRDRVWREILGDKKPQADKPKVRVPRECVAAVEKLLGDFTKAQVLAALKKFQ